MSDSLRTGSGRRPESRVNGTLGRRPSGRTTGRANRRGHGMISAGAVGRAVPTLSAADAIAGIPATLREELLNRFSDVVTNYRKRHWEAATLNAGKFVEVVYTILRGRADGAYPDHGQKPPDIVQACRKLEQEDEAKMGGRGMRILIPRAIPPVYEMRNNRGVGHAGAEVDPSQMDAEYALHSCQWMLEELVRVYHALDTETARAVVEALIARDVPLIWQVGGVKRVLDPNMRVQDRILVLLYATPGAVDVEDLCRWTEYKNPSRFRGEILGTLHDAALIHYDTAAGVATISPLGQRKAEERLLSGRVTEPDVRKYEHHDDGGSSVISSMRLLTATERAVD
jgi:hypothetical protein